MTTLLNSPTHSTSKRKTDETNSQQYGVQPISTAHPFHSPTLNNSGTLEEKSEKVKEKEVDNASLIVGDGSVDIKGRPIIRASTGGWKACGFIIGDELSERIAYYGIASNLISYLTKELHKGLAESARDLNNWAGVTTIAPLIGAFLADAYFGRYWTIFAHSIIYVIGIGFLTLSVSFPTLKPPPCKGGTNCPKVSSGKIAFFFFSLYLVSLGTGGVKPCLQAFGGDQFDEEDAIERKSKSSFFNWWYFGLCTGALVAFTVLVYIQDNLSWGLGFGIPTISMSIALAIFLMGTPFYRHKRPGGSPFSRIAQVFVAAARKWHVTTPSNSNLLYEKFDQESLRVGRRQLLHTDDFKFLDKAAVEMSDIHGESSSWLLCTVTQVEEAKLFMRILPVWLCTLMYGLVLTQLPTFFTKQGSTMDTHLGNFRIPAASLQTFTTITILIFLPFYDRVLVPTARRITGHERGISLLQRIGVGLALSVIAMSAAALSESKRLAVVQQHDLSENPKAVIPLTIFWLLPQYIIMGVSDVFAMVGQQEFFYDQVPDTMRSLGMALYLGATGAGNFLSSFLITIVENVTSHDGNHNWINNNLNQARLDKYYWLVAALSIVNLFFYLLASHFYTYKKAERLVSKGLLDIPSQHQEYLQRISVGERGSLLK